LGLPYKKNPLELGMRKDLNISSEMGSLRLVEKAIDEISLELDMSDEVYGNVLVATMEATNNAIIHGNNSDPSKLVKIEIQCLEKELKVHIEDQGNGFDHMNVPDPTAPENLEKINGRGIFLMERLSDEILYLADGRIVELKFKL
jgi:serine/threonine-protein kinase RsbW